MTYEGPFSATADEPAHKTPVEYSCPLCTDYAIEFDAGSPWPYRVAVVRSHLISAHKAHHLPPDREGREWMFPEDYPA
jgi:hypothetical protein